MSQKSTPKINKNRGERTAKALGDNSFWFSSNLEYWRYGQQRKDNDKRKTK